MWGGNSPGSGLAQTRHQRRSNVEDDHDESKEQRHDLEGSFLRRSKSSTAWRLCGSLGHASRAIGREYWEHEPCASCEAWWVAHNALHDALKLPPWQHPVFSHPDETNPWPEDSVRGREWNASRERQDCTLYHELKAATKTKINKTENWNGPCTSPQPTLDGSSHLPSSTFLNKSYPGFEPTGGRASRVAPNSSSPIIGISFAVT